MKSKAAMLITRGMQARCFTEEDVRRIRNVADLRLAGVDECTEASQLAAITGADILITGWGTQPITTLMLDAAPGLKLMCHSAGSVKGMIDADEFIRRGIRVCTARHALAVGVAEFAFAMMLASMKAVWQANALTLSGRWDRDAVTAHMREPYGAAVGIVGASNVGREMVRLCRALALGAILLYDPYVSREEAARMGCEKVELDELMRRADAVSLHTPATEECRHIINAGNLVLMRDGAVFINTARGMCVDETALIAELERGRIVACLDVTEPEPPEPGSPLYSLPNCILTPHIAGAAKENIFRQGRQVIEQIEAFANGRVMFGELDLRHYDRMA